MSRPYAVGLLILLGLLLLAAMWWGWRRRVARTGADLAPGADTLGDGDLFADRVDDFAKNLRFGVVDVVRRESFK